MEDKQRAAPVAFTKEIQVPEWEHTATHGSLAGTTTKTSLLSRISAKYRNVMSSTTTSQPSQPSRVSSRSAGRRWCGMTRWMLIALFLGFTLIVAGVIVGVVVGLTRAKQDGNSSNSQNLPLPGNSQTFTGQLTYYATSLGACGVYSGGNDYIVAVSHILFDAAGSSTATGGNSNNNPLCNRKLRATRFDSAVGQQRSVDLTVVDRCEGCAATDLDTSIGVFGNMAAIDQGRVDVTWAWL